MTTARYALILALAATRALTAQTPPDLAAKADALMKASGIQGSVLLAKGGQIILSKGYGLANIELDVRNTPETKFRLGSITKQFTSAGILQLQEQGKLNVTDPISKYIPNAPDTWSRVTIQHLLTHTSGIPSYTDNPNYGPSMRDRVTSPLEFVKRFRDLPLDFEPGSQFHYDNSGYFLLGVIIEQVSGMKYEDYLWKNIFYPLEMFASGYDSPTKLMHNRASGYARNASGTTTNAEFLDMGQPYAAGSLYSTVLDLYKWDRALYTTKVLSAKSIEAAFTPNKSNYGYGWSIEQIHGHKVVSHEGGINGFSTVIIRAIEEDAVAIVFSNFPESGNVSKTGHDLLELVLNAR